MKENLYNKIQVKTHSIWSPRLWILVVMELKSFMSAWRCHILRIIVSRPTQSSSAPCSVRSAYRLTWGNAIERICKYLVGGRRELLNICRIPHRLSSWLAPGRSYGGLTELCVTNDPHPLQLNAVTLRPLINLLSLHISVPNNKPQPYLATKHLPCTTPLQKRHTTLKVYFVWVYRVAQKSKHYKVSSLNRIKNRHYS